MINGRVRNIQSDMPFAVPAITTGAVLGRSWKRVDLYPVAKRLLDVSIALIMLAVLAPIMAIVALAVRLDSNGPIIFRQTRVGRNHRPFTFYKFRSMRHNADTSVHQKFVKSLINGAATDSYKINSDKRVTRVGKFIRKTSLDELPQLVNIVKGDMSLVGPRPPIPYEVAEYKEWHHRRLDVLPGLTGMWQVMGRSEVSFDEMVAMDIAYVDQRSLRMDLALLAQTVPAVLTGRGAR